MRSKVWLESFKEGPGHKWDVYNWMALREKLCVGMWVRFICLVCPCVLWDSVQRCRCIACVCRSAFEVLICIIFKCVFDSHTLSVNIKSCSVSSLR